ncbi:anhydro-N-acetylmuramic acid kinase, partial [Burkholderia sp. SIMBA_045]
TLKLEAHHSLSFPPELRAGLLALSHTDTWQADELAGLDIAFSELCAKVVRQLLEQADITAKEVTAIASHGQTVRHKPNSIPAYTCQIGD